MMIFETIKEHPGMIVGGIAVFVVVLYLAGKGGGATPAGDPAYAGSVDAATSLQNAQLAAAAQGRAIDASLAAHAADTAASIRLAEIGAGAQESHDTLAASVATSQLNAQLQLGSLMSTLQAGVQTNAQNKAVEQTAIIATNQTQQQQILASALVQQQQINSDTVQAVAKRKCGFLGAIFGC